MPGLQLALALLALQVVLTPTQAWNLQQAAQGRTHARGSAARILQQIPSACTPSTLQGYECALDIVGKGPSSFPLPAHARMHWTVYTDAEFGPAVRFAAEVWRPEDGIAPGWVGLGFSQPAPASHPPQMINATAVFGYINNVGAPVLQLYDLHAKQVLQIVPQRNGFTYIRPSVTLQTGAHLLLEFSRAFDEQFKLDTPTDLIMAASLYFHGLHKHDYRSAIKVTFAQPGSARTVNTRLNNRKMQAHAWCMFVAFGVILPMGAFGARYFRDLFGRWYFVHAGMQMSGLLLGVAGALISLTQNGPIPRSLRHFQLGVAVLLMAIAQPLTSIPRFMTHHRHRFTSMYWAYLHWTNGRAAIIFAWVNMFLGIGRYRTWFNLGSWPEAALGCYIGGLILLGLALEANLWFKSERRRREENDELSKRITQLEQGGGKGGSPAPWAQQGLTEDDEDAFLDQSRTYGPSHNDSGPRQRPHANTTGSSTDTTSTEMARMP